jgi:hypothetical protein
VERCSRNRRERPGELTPDDLKRVVGGAGVKDAHDRYDGGPQGNIDKSGISWLGLPVR